MVSNSQLSKICFFNSHKAWGGGEKWHFEMAQRLFRKGGAVLLVSNRDSELFERVQETEIPSRAMRITNTSFLNPLKIWRLVRFLKSEQVHTIILNLPSDLKAAGMAARIAGVKQIIYRRGSAIPIRDTFLNRFLFKNVVTDIIANSEETKRTVLSKKKDLFPEDKIHVIYNGIDLEAYDRQPVGDGYQRVPGEIVLGHAGRLSRQKNQKFLVDVAARLKERGVSFRLLIAGTGALEADLKDYVARQGLVQEVEFLGFVQDMKAFMESIDIFLLSSLWEGFGYVLVEAMAAGKPVVAFDSSSNPEVVHNGQTGHLVEPQNCEQFTCRLEALVHSPEQRRLFGEAGRKRVEELFVVETAVDKLSELVGI